MERDETYVQAPPSSTGAEQPQTGGWLQGEEQAEGFAGAQVVRLRPLRVLIVSADEPFRAVNAMLIGRRDCEVFSLAGTLGAAELIARERIDVAVIDGAEPLRAIADELIGASPPVGVVSVGEAADVGLPGGPMLERWAPFDELFDTLVRVDRARVRERGPAGGRSPAGQSRPLR